MTEPEEPEGPEGPTAADLERAILGAAPEMRGSDVAQSAGVSLADARRLWRALGFPDAAGTAAFTEADVEALNLAYRAVVESGLDQETMLRLTRALGQTAARLADWEVATLSGVAADRAGGPGGSRQVVMSLVESLGPSFDRLLVYAWRRHLAAAIGRMDLLASDEDELDVAEATVGFADLVRFTALTNRLDEGQIGDLVEVFESRCADIIADHDARLIKTLGDSVLFLHADPAVAVDVGLGIVAGIGRDDRLPDVRLGLATGPVVLRMGDVYGPAVNLAARLTSVARRNRVIIDQHTAELLPVTDFETRPIPARPMRGFGDVVPVTVRRVRGRR